MITPPPLKKLTDVFEIKSNLCMKKSYKLTWTGGKQGTTTAAESVKSLPTSILKRLLFQHHLFS